MDKRDPSVCRQYDPTSAERLLLVTLIPSAVLFASAILCLICLKRRGEANNIWKINRDELTFGEPPQVLGQGTFGLVLLAEFRGTMVAVKRVIPPNTTRSAGEVSKRLSIGDVESQDAAGVGATPEQAGSLSGKMSMQISTVKDKRKKRSKSDDAINHAKLTEDFLVEMEILAKLRYVSRPLAALGFATLF